MNARIADGRLRRRAFQDRAYSHPCRRAPIGAASQRAIGRRPPQAPVRCENAHCAGCGCCRENRFAHTKRGKNGTKGVRPADAGCLSSLAGASASGVAPGRRTQALQGREAPITGRQRLDRPVSNSQALSRMASSRAPGYVSPLVFDDPGLLQRLARSDTLVRAPSSAGDEILGKRQVLAVVLSAASHQPARERRASIVWMACGRRRTAAIAPAICFMPQECGCRNVHAAPAR